MHNIRCGIHGTLCTSLLPYLHAFRGWRNIKPPIEEGWRAARMCHQRGKKLWLLSNYPREDFEYISQQLHADRFSIFDGGTISCYCHHNKPEDPIFETLMRDCQFIPGRALFIDDMQKNIDAAMKHGIHGFHMHKEGMLNSFFVGE